MAKSRLSEADIRIKTYNFIMLWLGIDFALSDVQRTMFVYGIWQDVQAGDFKRLVERKKVKFARR